MGCQTMASRLNSAAKTSPHLFFRNFFLPLVTFSACFFWCSFFPPFFVFVFVFPLPRGATPKKKIAGNIVVFLFFPFSLVDTRHDRTLSFLFWGDWKMTWEGTCIGQCRPCFSLFFFFFFGCCFLTLLFPPSVWFHSRVFFTSVSATSHYFFPSTFFFLLLWQQRTVSSSMYDFRE